jgi:DNA repair exonuclease SbcCD ATPase subunit
LSNNITKNLNALQVKRVSTLSPSLDEAFLFQSVDVNAFRAAHELSLSELAGIETEVATANVSLNRLNELLATPKPTQVGAPCTSHGASSCPTCGQELNETSKDRRREELTALVTTLTARRTSQVAVVRTAKVHVDAALQLKPLQDQLRGVIDRRGEVANDLLTLQSRNSSAADEIKQLEARLAKIALDKVAVEGNYASRLKSQTEALRSVEDQYATSLRREQELKVLIDRVRQTEKQVLNAQVQLNSTIAICSDRLKTSQANTKERLGDIYTFIYYFIFSRYCFNLIRCLNNSIIS